VPKRNSWASGVERFTSRARNSASRSSVATIPTAESFSCLIASRIDSTVDLTTADVNIGRKVGIWSEGGAASRMLRGTTGPRAKSGAGAVSGSSLHRCATWRGKLKTLASGKAD